MRVLVRNLGSLPFSLDIGDFYYGDMCRELLAPAGDVSGNDVVDIGDRVNVWDLNVQDFIRGLIVPEGGTRVVSTITDGYRVTATPAGQCSVDFLGDPDDLLFLVSSAGGGGGSLPAATAVGQVLLSLNGTTFVPALPLTGPDGWLVDSAGLLLVAEG